MVQLYGNSRNLVPVNMGAGDRSLMAYFVIQVSSIRINLTAPQYIIAA